MPQLTDRNIAHQITQRLPQGTIATFGIDLALDGPNTARNRANARRRRERQREARQHRTATNSAGSEHTSNSVGETAGAPVEDMEQMRMDEDKEGSAEVATKEP